MAKLDLYVRSNCVPCRHVERFIKKHNVEHLFNIISEGYHPLVSDRPALVINDASVIKGVMTLEHYIYANLVPMEVTDNDETLSSRPAE